MISLLALLGPILIIGTIFLFNIGTKEIIEGKSGFNTSYFSGIAYSAIFIYLLAPLFIVFFLLSKNVEVEILKHVIMPFITILFLFCIYHYSYKFFKEKREHVFYDKEDYDPSIKKILGISNNGLFFIVILICSTLSFCNIYNAFKLENIIAISLKTSQGIFKNINVLSLVYLVTLIIMPYTFTILSAGYIFNYGIISDLKQNRIILDDKGVETLKIMGVIMNSNILYAYILLESDESTVIKINEIDRASIRIKTEYILNKTPTEYLTDQAPIEYLLNDGHNKNMISETSILNESHQTSFQNSSIYLDASLKDGSKLKLDIDIEN